MARKKHLINVHTGTGTTEPSEASLYLGEIAVQHTPNNPALWIKVGENESSNIYEKFIGETEIIDLLNNTEIILGSGYTYSGIPYVTSATNISDAYSALTEIVLNGESIEPLSAAVISLSAGVKSNEYVAASALNYLNARINELSGNTGSGAEPLSAAVISLSGAVVTISGSSGGDIEPLSSATHSHVTNNNIHVTSQDKTTWDEKQDAIQDLSDIRSWASSGASAYTAVTALSSVTEDHIEDTDIHLPEVTSSDNGKVLQVEQGSWTPKMPINVYGGTEEPSSDLGNNGDIYLQSNPVVIYETDGTTGLLGHNQNGYDNQWQLENLDLTPYKEIRCYFKASNTGDSSTYTPAVVVTVPLDDAAKGPNIYTGAIMVPLPFNRNREYLVSCAVDTTKTKFQVIHQNTLWDITTSDANNTGRYLYKIEAYV